MAFGTERSAPMRAAPASVPPGQRVTGFRMRRTAMCLARAMRVAAQRAPCVTPAFRHAHASPRRNVFAATATSAEDTATSSTPWVPAPLAPVTSAYVHLPFCRRRCYYCDFAISVVGDNVESDQVRRGMEAYVDRLVREIHGTQIAPSTAAAVAVNGHSPQTDFPLRTVFFGGGTPSLVPPDLLEKVLDALREKFGLRSDAEVSIEMDPGTFDHAKLVGYLAIGVTRVSLGVQSFDPDTLQTAGRAHTVEEARVACGEVHKALKEAQASEQKQNKKSAKKYSWSLDLISGLPGSSNSTWRASLLEAVDKHPDHVSVYDLQIEEGTPFGRWYTSGVTPMPQEEDGATMFRDASFILGAENFEHYEVSSYAKPGKRCEHNQVYWNSGKQGWYAFGMAATSHVSSREQRVARPRKMKEWEAWVDAMSVDVATTSIAGDESDEKKNDEAKAEALLERLMLGLRTRDGVCLDSLAAEFGPNTPKEVLAVLKTQPPGLAVVVGADGNERDAVEFSPGEDFTNAAVRLTNPEGLMVSTEIISTLVARVPSLEAL